MRLFLTILLLTVIVPIALADTHGTGVGVSLPDPLGGKDFITILKQVVNFLIAAAIPIAALMIIYDEGVKIYAEIKRLKALRRAQGKPKLAENNEDQNDNNEGVEKA